MKLSLFRESRKEKGEERVARGERKEVCRRGFNDD